MTQKMSKVLIKHVPIHPLLYPNEGQTYVFNGCMKFLVECICKEKTEYDYWFFSCVSGDCFVQVFNKNKSKWSTCFSQSKFDYELIKRVFDSIGYHFLYIPLKKWKSELEETKIRIKESIDRGVPIIAKGFRSIIDGVEELTDETS